MNLRTQSVLGRSTLALGMCLAAASAAQAWPGADIRLTDSTDITTYAAVGGMRAYAMASSTCNMGNAGLNWTNMGTPALAMNAYRLYNGRLEQIGQGWCKLACCAANGNNCGVTCSSSGSGQLGPGCFDAYGSGYNGGQTRLGPRSAINPWTGLVGAPGSSNFDSITRRLQVLESDMNAANFPGALYFAEGVYVSTEDAMSHNSLNNCTYKRVNIAPGTYAMTYSGTAQVGIPAIFAWHDHGLGAGIPDPSVIINTVDVPGEGRFVVAAKPTALANGQFHYEYAVFNINSDRSGGSLSITIPPGAHVTNIGFKSVPYHSGEPYDNSPWTAAINTTTNILTWSSPATFAQNPNSNALRWGTMYNFWFDCDRPAGTTKGVIGLFKPGLGTEAGFTASGPRMCRGDFNHDGATGTTDIFGYVGAWFQNSPDAEMDGQPGITVNDIHAFLGNWFVGCN